MTNKEAISLFHDMQGCRHQALYTNDCGNCERCQYYLEHEQIDGAVALAISALEKQEVDKCCETCKYELLELDAYPCCDCIRAKDHYEPYTEEQEDD